MSQFQENCWKESWTDRQMEGQTIIHGLIKDCSGYSQGSKTEQKYGEKVKLRKTIALLSMYKTSFIP